MDTELWKYSPNGYHNIEVQQLTSYETTPTSLSLLVP
jgi:hypothetical protein